MKSVRNKCDNEIKRKCIWINAQFSVRVQKRNETMHIIFHFNELKWAALDFTHFRIVQNDSTGVKISTAKLLSVFVTLLPN